MTDSAAGSMANLSISSADSQKELPKTAIHTIYNQPSTTSITEIKRVFSDPTKEELECLLAKLDNDIGTTLSLIERIDDSKLLVQKLSKESSLAYLTHLRTSLRTTKTPEFPLSLIDSLVNNFEYTVDELTPVISSITPFIEHDIVVMTLIKFFALYQDKSISVLEEQLEVLSLQEEYVPSFKLMALMFQLEKEKAREVFGMESLQLLLSQVGPQKKSSVIKEGLLLLSVACVDDSLRKEISSRYLDLLISGAKSSDGEIRTLAALVIVKTWNFSSLEEKQSLTLDDLLDIFLSNEDLNEYSIEALAYLSIKASVKVRLRQDEAFIFDLTKLLEDPPVSMSYGILVLLANMTSIEEKNEVNELKKQANKGLDEGVEEDEADIEEFIQDLVERQVVSKICSISKMSKTSMNQVIIILYNVSKKRDNHAEMIKQGGLLRLLDFLAREEETSEIKVLAYQALCSLLITSNPLLVFNTYSPKSAVNFLFQFLGMPDTSMKDQFQCLLSLTNLSVMDNGRLSETQWDLIDDVLTQNNTLLRRAALELISNLMQLTTNLPDMFDPQSSKAKKRYELVVKMMRLEDIKSQCSAVASFSTAAGIPFVAGELVKDQQLVDTLITLVKEQAGEGDLMERVLFVVYSMVFHTENTAVFKAISPALGEVLKHNKNGEAKEMAQEIIQMLK